MPPPGIPDDGLQAPRVLYQTQALGAAQVGHPVHHFFKTLTQFGAGLDRGKLASDLTGLTLDRPRQIRDRRDGGPAQIEGPAQRRPLGPFEQHEPR